jgi:hypothetical protein
MAEDYCFFPLTKILLGVHAGTRFDRLERRWSRRSAGLSGIGPPRDSRSGVGDTWRWRGDPIAVAFRAQIVTSLSRVMMADTASKAFISIAEKRTCIAPANKVEVSEEQATKCA